LLQIGDLLEDLVKSKMYLPLGSVMLKDFRPSLADF
jgi:hypothetical protein